MEIYGITTQGGGAEDNYYITSYTILYTSSIYPAWYLIRRDDGTPWVRTYNSIYTFISYRRNTSNLKQAHFIVTHRS